MRKKWGLIAIFILGLIPLLWFKRGYLIGGVDFDMPLFPVKQFFLRNFTWNLLLGGSDYSMRLAGLYTFTATQALLRAIGLPMAVVQRIYFVLWYAVSGLAMYYFISSLIKDNDLKARIIRLFAVIFYMLNFYQLHIWMIARKPELSGAIIIPLMMGLLIRAFRKEISGWRLAGYAAVFSWLGSGMGCNPPVLGIFFISIFSVFIYRMFYLVLKGCGKHEIVNDFAIFGIISTVFVLVNLYWILPVANYIVQSSYLSTDEGFKVFNLTELLSGTSRHNSFLNVLRLYGDNIWFDGYKDAPYMPFFPTYQTNGIFIILSFMFPVLAFSVLLFSRNRYVIFFTGLTLVAAFIGKGIHPPLGNVFLWMFKHIPGFWVFRAPWQKFGLLMILGYSYLASLTCGEIYSYLKHHLILSPVSLSKRRKIIPAFFVVIIIILTIIYNYAFIMGKMLPTTEERKTLPGFHQKYPEYLFQSTDWIDSFDEEFNIILLPDDKANAYEWGYGAAYDITFKLFDKGIIFRQYGEGMSPPHSLDKVYQAFISSLYNETTPCAAKILGLLNVRYLLHRNDFLYDWSGDKDSPEFIREKISKQKDIRLEKSFGKWDFYRNNCLQPHIYASTDVIYVDGDIDYLPTLVSAPDYNSQAAYIFSRNKTDVSNFMSEIITEEISIPKSKITIHVYDGWKNPVNWNTISSEASFESRTYKGSKPLISTNGKGTQDMFVFNSPEECPYSFSLGSPRDHGMHNSTLVYIKTGIKPLEIGKIYADGKPVVDIVDIWWETGHAKQHTNSILYPLKIPANERAVIQINHLVENEIVLAGSTDKLYRLDKRAKGVSGKKDEIKVNYKRVNPTRYVVKIQAKSPFMLIFSERYNQDWKAYIKKTDGEEFEEGEHAKSVLVNAWKDRGQLIELKKHLQVNGFANAWWIDLSEHETASGNFEIILEYIPQRLFEIGMLVSILTFIGCISSLMWFRT